MAKKKTTKTTAKKKTTKTTAKKKTAKKKTTKKKPEEKPTSLLGEVSCLLICTGVVWMLFVPDTIQKAEDGAITISPDYIPLMVLGAGFVLMVMISLFDWSENA
jgi:hypothetical protein